MHCILCSYLPPWRPSTPPAVILTMKKNSSLQNPFTIFARSRITRGGGYGSAPVEILPVPGPSYSNQQIDSLPNYGGPQIAPIKEVEHYSPGGGGYGGGAPIKKEPYKAPAYSGGSGFPASKPVESGYGGSAPVGPAPGYGGAGLPPGYGGASAPIKQEQPYVPSVPNYGGSGGHKQPFNYGYNSGSGISFGQGWSSSPQQQPQQQPHYGGGGGQGFQQKQPFNQGGTSGYGGSPTGHDSYSKPPVVQEGYGTPLAPPAQKAPGGYGRRR
ncbi:glycine-rich cell wall structural protein 1.0 [Folsomia candida]|uniref:glycine-rich cell wall structural protein 1.0 n=1 Tax=Folsomia candida TaxID=158441 RepID=UPI000B8F73E0|nr:glycine-rich cell wall structural protein 1.0 [Folsomia candida]